MNSIIELLQNAFYPFWYFLVLGLVMEAAKILTMFFVAGGRLKSFHAIENYWIYLLLAVFCILTGVIFGHGSAIQFTRWSVCPLFSGLIGIYYGYEKAEAISDEELKEMKEEADEMD